MITTKIRLGSLLTLTFMLASSIEMFNYTYAQESNQILDWSIEANKNMYYPGEPVLLTLNIMNKGTHEEKLDFGADGIEAFSLEIRDSNDNIVAKGGKIQRFGVTMKDPFTAISPNNICHKSVVLNQWCSTLLPADQYHIICNIEYRLRSEDRKQAGTMVIKAGPIHKTQLELDIQIIKMDSKKFKEIIENLASYEIQTASQNKGEWLNKRELAREMLAFTESDLAVPYQLKLLRVEKYTWLKQDIVNSIVKSGTSEAAIGLMQTVEDPNIYKEDIKPFLIDGIYRLRETRKPEILSVTNDFVSKHSRPIISPPID